MPIASISLAIPRWRSKSGGTVRPILEEGQDWRPAPLVSWTFPPWWAASSGVSVGMILGQGREQTKNRSQSEIREIRINLETRMRVRFN